MTCEPCRSKDGKRYNSVVMGLLVDEYKDAYPDGISSHVIEWDGQEI